MFCGRWCEKTIFTLSTGPDRLQFTILAFFSISKAFLAFKLDSQSKGDLNNGCIFNFSKSIILYLIFKYKFDTKYQ